MAKLLMLRGLPGSGKTRWALKWVALDPLNRLRISRTEIRTMFGMPHQMEEEREKVISGGVSTMVRAALHKGYDVCLDDHNLSPLALEKWQTYAVDNNYPMEILHFPASPEICILRNNSRPEAPDAKVVYKLYEKYVRANINYQGEEPLDPVELLAGPGS